MDTLPVELYVIIGVESSYQDITNLRLVSKYLQTLIDRKEFWLSLYAIWFPQMRFRYRRKLQAVFYYLYDQYKYWTGNDNQRHGRKGSFFGVRDLDKYSIREWEYFMAKDSQDLRYLYLDNFLQTAVWTENDIKGLIYYMINNRLISRNKIKKGLIILLQGRRFDLAQLLIETYPDKLTWGHLYRVWSNRLIKRIESDDIAYDWLRKRLYPFYN